MGRLRPLPCEGGIIFSTTKQDGKLTALVTVGIMASKMHRTWGLKHMGLLYIKKCDFIVEMVGNFNHYSSTVLVRFISNQQKKNLKQNYIQVTIQRSLSCLFLRFSIHSSKKKFHILTSHVSCGLAVKKNPNKLHQDCFKAIIFLACKKVESGASKNLNLNYSFSVDYSIFFCNIINNNKLIKCHTFVDFKARYWLEYLTQSTH